MYWDRDVILIEKYDVICNLWKWLQKCSKSDILSIKSQKQANILSVPIKVERVLIEYKDRETKEKKYEEELAEDIMKILTCYSSRFYRRRGGRKKKNTNENELNKSNRI